MQISHFLHDKGGTKTNCFPVITDHLPLSALCRCKKIFVNVNIECVHNGAFGYVVSRVVNCTPHISRYEIKEGTTSLTESRFSAGKYTQGVHICSFLFLHLNGAKLCSTP